ncbi:hypothetical protein A2Z33_00260 [Candidatus Gottesmanbacteria bacterium RBG_16_52_11]|uniref:Uncharacterized protein n=1 Tax=Candidatus Gottesmanbacteria bacterium RBG_16_52_11 TaxID=1798374 RepID=A0A1F5YNH5_9BACT|nr:MAG: hypothetical protein A2Z33_00260 [Candidatus Gottesmanbacteria bacterium RBG_16_52_11]
MRENAMFIIIVNYRDEVEIEAQMGVVPVSGGCEVGGTVRVVNVTPDVGVPIFVIVGLPGKTLLIEEHLGNIGSVPKYRAKLWPPDQQ